VDDRKVPVAHKPFKGLRAMQLAELCVDGEQAGQIGSLTGLGAPRGHVTTQDVK
jgi:hypothetical protein